MFGHISDEVPIAVLLLAVMLATILAVFKPFGVEPKTGLAHAVRLATHG